MIWADREPWMDEAACKGLPPEIHFPNIVDDNGEEIIDDGQGVGDTAPYYTQARVICRACPVRKECLNFALFEKERYGCWGGLIPIERLRIERKGRRDRLRERRKLEREQGLL